MRDTITVPAEYRAYEMARYEIEVYHPEAPRLKLTDLNFKGTSPGVFIAIFHRPDYPNILRVYWPDKDYVDYYYLVNYHQLKTRHSAVVEALEKNGAAYYEQQLAIDEEEKRTSEYYIRNPAIAAAFGEPRTGYELEIVPNSPAE